MLTLKEQFIDRIIQHKCSMQGITPPLDEDGAIDWRFVDKHHVGPMEQMRDNAFELADDLTDIVLKRLEGTMAARMVEYKDSIDNQLGRFATAIGDVTLTPNEQEQVARVIVDARLGGVGILLRNEGGQYRRKDPITVELHDRRL